MHCLFFLREGDLVLAITGECPVDCDKLSLFFKLAVTSHHFVEPLVTLCLEPGLTLPMGGGGSKAGVDPSSPVLCSHFHIMILRINSEFSGLGLVPILHFSMLRLPLEWPSNITSRMAGRFKPTALQLKARCFTHWAWEASATVLNWDTISVKSIYFVQQVSWSRIKVSELIRRVFTVCYQPKWKP